MTFSINNNNPNHLTPSYRYQNSDIDTSAQLAKQNTVKSDIFKRPLSPTEVQKYSWLNQHEGINSHADIDISSFAHQTASGFIQHTSFEGSSFNITLPSFINFLKSRSENIELIPLFENCLKYSKKISNAITCDKKNITIDELYAIRKKHIHELAKEISQDIQNLKIGEKILVPGGWGDADNSGHAMLYLIERKTEHEFSFDVINTGAGLTYHSGFADESGQVKNQLFLHYDHLPKIELNKSFIELLISIKLIPHWRRDLKPDQQLLYEEILSKLDNARITPPLDPELHPSFYIKPQRSGTCTMKSLFAAYRLLTLKPLLDSAKTPQEITENFLKYKKFRFDFQKKSLTEMCRAFFKNDCPWDRSSHVLILNACQVLANMALKLDRDSSISSEDLLGCQATILDIKRCLKEKKSQAKSKNINKAYKIPQVFQSEDSRFASKIAAYSILPGNETESKEEKTIKFPVYSPIMIPKDAIDILQQWALFDLKQAEEHKSLLQVKALDTLRKLPIPSTDTDDFWKKIPKDKIDICLIGLNQLTRCFLIDNANDPGALNAPSTLIEAHTALAIGEHLARRSYPNKLKGYKLPYDRLINLAMSPLTILYNPIDQERLEKLIEYFNPDIDLRKKIGNGKDYETQEALFKIKTHTNNINSKAFIENLEFNKETIKSSSELAFYRQFINHPDIQKLNPESLEDAIELVATMATSTNGLIPKTLFHLKDIAIIAQLLPVNGEKRPERFPCTHFEFSLLRTFMDLRLCYKSTTSSKSDKEFIKFSDKDVLHLNNSLEDTLKRNDQNTIMGKLKTALETDVLIQTVNAHDEAVRALTYLETYPLGELEDPIKQQVLLSHLFRPEVLLPQIIQEPRVGLKIISILQKHLDYFYQTRKWTTCLFIAEMCNKCSDYYHYAKKSYPKKFSNLRDDSIINYRTWILEKIGPECHDESLFLNMYEVLTNLYVSKDTEVMSKTELMHFSVDWITYSILNNLQSNSSNLPHITSSGMTEKTLMGARYLPEIKNLMGKNQKARDQILNEIASVLTHHPIKLSWNGKYPLYTAGGNTINIVQMTYTGSSQFVNLIPKKLLKSIISVSANHIFDGITQTSRISKGDGFIYKIQDKHGTTNIEEKDYNAYVHRHIDGYDYLLTQNLCELFCSDYESDSDSDDNNRRSKLPPSLFSREDSISWYCQDEKNPHCLIENKDGRKLYIFPEIDSAHLTKDYFNFKKIKTIKDSNEGGRILINHHNIDKFNLLSEFAGNTNIFVWAKASSRKLDEIEIPELGLHFELKTDRKGIKRLFLKEDNDFFISRHQLMEYRRIWPPYLVLENSKGARKVLMKEIKDYPETQLTTNFDPNFNLTCKQRLLSYDLQKDLGKWTLLPTSTYDTLHLVWVHLLSKRYKKALLLLPKCQSLRKYNKEEMLLISLILKSADKHPQAISILLKLALLSMENKELFSKKQESLRDPPFVHTSFQLFNNYLTNLSYSEFNGLTQEDKLSLMLFLNRSPDQFIKDDPQWIGVNSSLLNPNKMIRLPLDPDTLDSDSNSRKYIDLDKQEYKEYLGNDAFQLFVSKHKNAGRISKLQSPSFEEKRKMYQIEDPEHLIKKKLLDLNINTIFKTDLKLANQLHEIDNKWDKIFTELQSDANVDLNALVHTTSQRLMKEKKALIELANDISAEADLTEQFLSSKNPKQKLVIDDLIYLFAQGSLQKYHDVTKQTNNQIRTLDNRLGNYIVEATRLNQLKHIINIKSALDSTSDKQEQVLLQVQIKNELAKRRKYSFSSQNNEIARLYLTYEYQNKILLRDKQITAIKSIDSDDPLFKELLLELGTGTGKSKVIAPIINRLRQKGTNLVFNIWPQSLYNTNTHDMKELSGHSFGQKSDVFIFNRKTPIDSFHLFHIFRNLIKAKNEGQQINTTPESLQCFELKFLEIFANTSLENSADSLILMKAIMELIHHSEFHIDEAHINLSPKKEVNFTIGTPESLPSEQILFIQKIFRFFTTEEASKVLGITEDNQRFVNSEELKKIFIHLAEYLSEDLNVKENEKESYIDFVMGGQPADWMYNHPNKDLIVLLRENITNLFPSIFQKSVNVNFGLSHKHTNIKYAKPYHGNDTPIENAEYENIIETLIKTHLIYLYQGLSEENLWEIIQYFQEKSRRESLEMQINISETPSNLEFTKLFKNKFPLLNGIVKASLTSSFQELKHSHDLISFYISTIIAPTITKYPQKLKSTPQDLLRMADKFIAMTATPGEPKMYRPDIEYKKPIQNDQGKTNEQMVLEKFEKDNGQIHSIAFTNPSEILKHTSTLIHNDIRMLIDVGALYKGLSNYTIARTLQKDLQNSSEIQGIVYFDEQDRMVVLKKDRSEPIPIEQCSLTPFQLFTYCDQRHAFGTDTKQSLIAKALVTFDSLTTTDELIQGIGRLRQFLDGQSVEIVMTDKTKALIHKDKEITIQDLRQFAKQNQDDCQDELCMRALLHQMNGEIRSVLMNSLTMSEKETEMSFLIFSKVQSILIETVDSKLTLPEKQAKPQIENPLLAHCERLIDIVTSFENDPVINCELSNQIKSLKDRIEKYKPRIIEITKKIESRAKLRNKPINLKAFQLGTEIEVHNETETNTNDELNNDLENATAMDTLMNYSKPCNWPTELDPYDPKWIESFRSKTSGNRVVLYDVQELAKQTLTSSIIKTSILLTCRSPYKILCTNNFLTSTSRILEDSYSPFTKDQKTAYEVLLIEDVVDEVKQWTIILGDQSTDALFWRDRLDKISKSESRGQQRKICLYDLTLGIVKDSPNQFNEETLQNNEALQELITKVKLYNGNIMYTPIQKKFITNLVSKNPLIKQHYKKYFEEILIWRPNSRKLYKGSWIQSILNS